MHNDMHLSSCGDSGQSLQSCLTLCNPMDRSLPDFFVHWVFSQQESWSGLPYPPPGYLPNPGIKPMSPALQADSLRLSHWGSPSIIIVSYKIFSLPQHTLCSIFPSHPLQCQINSDPFTVCIVLPFLERHIVGIIQY